MRRKLVQDFDWKKIQEMYDLGHTTEELFKVNGFPKSWKSYYKAVDLGLFKFRTRSESRSNYIKLYGPTRHSQKTKDKLSKIRKAFILANPDKAPYKMNHHSKGPSYPEQYFKELFQKEGIQLESEKSIGLYSLDFASELKMVDIEIDGEQHYCDIRIAESDIRRTKYLESLGWKVFRIRWRLWVKMDIIQKKEIIQEIRNLLK